jgi:hypothetical protein
MKRYFALLYYVGADCAAKRAPRDGDFNPLAGTDLKVASS